MGIIRYFRVVIFRRGFNYHHAEAGYAMLTFWIPDLSSMLSSDSSHHFGAAAFLINDNKEVPFSTFLLISSYHSLSIWFTSVRRCLNWCTTCSRGLSGKSKKKLELGI